MDPTLLIALAAVSVAAGAIAQSVTGMGFSLVAAPALLALLGPREGVAVVVVLAALSSVLPLSRQWEAVRVRDVTSLLVPTLLATPVIAIALAGVDTRLVAVAAGVAVLLGVVLLWRGASWEWFTGIPGAIGTGLASAVLNVVGGVGGPPVGLFAANAGWRPVESRATLQGFFLVQNIVTALVIGLLLPQWWMVAALILGTLVGTAIAHRVPARAARLAVLAAAAVGGATLVVANA